MLLWQFPLFYPSMGQSSHIWRTDLIPWEGICNPCSIRTVAFQPDLRSVSLLYFIWRKQNYFTACFQIIFDLIGHNQSERVKILPQYCLSTFLQQIQWLPPPVESSRLIIPVSNLCIFSENWDWIEWTVFAEKQSLSFSFFFFLLPHQLGFAMFQKRVMTYKDTD